MLNVTNVSKSYGNHLALDGVSLDVAEGQILGLLGPNGAGKTTLVSIVAGLRRPDAGRVEVDGIDVVRSPQAARALIGLAPQDTGVYPTLNVATTSGSSPGSRVFVVASNATRSTPFRLRSCSTG